MYCFFLQKERDSTLCLCKHKYEETNRNETMREHLRTASKCSWKYISTPTKIFFFNRIYNEDPLIYCNNYPYFALNFFINLFFF